MCTFQGIFYCGADIEQVHRYYAVVHITNVAGIWNFLCGSCANADQTCRGIQSSMQLLSVLGAGFLQGLYALEAADGTSEEASKVCRSSDSR